MNISISRQNCSDPTELASREWLDVNGSGGYASGTVAGPPSRKYHGLLVANLPAPASGRHVLVTALEERFDTKNGTFLLSGVDCTARPWTDTVYPEQFTIEPAPTWTYRVGALEVERTILMMHRRDAVLIRYRFQADSTATGGRLALGPLLAFRRNHALAHRNPYLSAVLDTLPGGFRIAPYPGMPSLFCQVSAPCTVDNASAPEWREGVFYRVERDRGYPAHEDLFRPATVSVEFAAGDTVIVAFATEQLEDIETLFQEELDRRRDALDTAREAARRFARNKDDETLCTALLASAETFIVRVPPDRPTVLAGYHWFEDWGRDTLIALPGLAFVRGRLEAGLEVLRTFVDYERDGRIPNYIGPEGAGAYNSVDAPLWLFWTLQQYLFYGGSLAEVRRFWPAMKRILDRLAADDEDDDAVYLAASGLLHSGTPTTQLTWMDAAVDGRPVTPRYGFAVEICALWYNAVCFARQVATAFGEVGYAPPADPAQIAAAFRDRFYLPNESYLADVVNDDGVDASLRPNQVLAVSLPYSAVAEARARGIVTAVQNALLTPRGLRTLAPDAPAYRGRYEGPVRERDHAYHQGTVWPWLLGHFGEAYLKTHGWRTEARDYLRGTLNGWLPHLLEAGVGSVSEVFDGDTPHRPDGCIAQAWSVAELIRLFSLVEEGPFSCEF